jgi:hypothetical protein
MTFNTKIFTYSTYVDASLTTRGTLAAHPSYTSGNAGSGRVLHANGRFLNVGTHPDVTKYYMGVYDPVYGFSGFIDPTDTAFAPYDTNLPSPYDLGTSGAAAPPLGGSGQGLRIVDSGNLTQASLNAGVDAGSATTGQITIYRTPGGGPNDNSTSCVVTSTSVKPTSRILLTMVGTTATTGIAYTVDDITTGAFTIRLPDNDIAFVFHFLVLNTNV